MSTTHYNLEASKRSFARRLSFGLLFVNVIGAIVYVVRASAAWRIPEEHGVVPITGEPFVWFAAILPVVVVFFALNFSWGAYICFNRKWQIGYYWLIVLAVWFVAIWIDFAHH
jgi:hypothetical protein